MLHVKCLNVAKAHSSEFNMLFNHNKAKHVPFGHMSKCEHEKCYIRIACYENRMCYIIFLHAFIVALVTFFQYYEFSVFILTTG